MACEPLRSAGDSPSPRPASSYSVPLPAPPTNPTTALHETNPCHGNRRSCALMGLRYEGTYIGNGYSHSYRFSLTRLHILSEIHLTAGPWSTLRPKPCPIASGVCRVRAGLNDMSMLIEGRPTTVTGIFGRTRRRLIPMVMAAFSSGFRGRS